MPFLSQSSNTNVISVAYLKSSRVTLAAPSSKTTCPKVARSTSPCFRVAVSVQLVSPLRLLCDLTGALRVDRLSSGQSLDITKIHQQKVRQRNDSYNTVR